MARQRTEAYNARRRERYVQDPTYREKAKAATRAHNKANPEKVTARKAAEYRRDPEKFLHRNRLDRFGINPEQYQAMLSAQNGACKICRRTCASGRALAVDHCHTTGKIRGLLCARCNGAIGMCGDDPLLLRSCADYLEAV